MRSKRSYRMPILIVAFCLVTPQTAQADGSAEDPSQPGPYPVGVTTLTFQDHSRQEKASGGSRSLLTEIWYPATDETRGLPPNKHSNFFARGQNKALNMALRMAFGIDVMALDDQFENRAVRDARIRDGVFPLILFSHGNGGVRMQSVFLCEHLASHGYVVVAPDHTGNAGVTTVNGKLVPMDQSGRHDSAVARPRDVSFLIDTMERLNKGGDSRFTGRLDMQHIGVTGHSFGGYTTTWVADSDPRVRAIAPITGVGRTRKNFDIPVLVIVATEDATMGVRGNEQCRRYYADSRGPRYLVEYKNGGHFSFTEMFQYKPEHGDGVGTGKRIISGEPLTYAPRDVVHRYTNGYMLAFFDRYLRDRTEREAYLRQNALPKEIIHAAGGQQPQRRTATRPKAW